MIATALLAQLIVGATAATRVAPTAAARAPRPVLVSEAGSGAPVASASVTSHISRAVTNVAGVARLGLEGGDTVRIRRVGYRAAALVVPTYDHAPAAGADTLFIALSPVAAFLPAVVTHGERSVEDAGRLVASRSVAEAREAGAGTTAGLLAMLPFVAVRGARGEATLSMRGSRAEQVAVTLDGLVLNDAGTGRADASDIPLAALGDARARPGTSGVTAGSGAVGGVVALSSGDGDLLSVRSGAFGVREAEGASSIGWGTGRVRIGASWREARNDFAFTNTDGATGSDSTERRANNDERRLALFASGAWPRAQFTLLASHAERGLVGPMNVRIYDADRGRTTRLLARTSVALGNWTASLGVRTQMLAYRSAAAPALDFEATTLSPDVELSGDAGVIALRAGAGMDGGQATGMALPQRARGFLAAERGWQWSGARLSAGIRLDAIERAGTLPSASIALEGTGVVAPFVRLSQAFRAPTLYDLYFASPQRLTASPLVPERVTYDAETGLRAQVGAVTLGATAFAREVRDAIVWFPGNFTWSPGNAGLERVRGVEGFSAVAGASYAASVWGSLTASTLDAGGLVLQTPYVPRASGGATLTLRVGGFGVTTSVLGIGRRAFAAAPASASTELPAVMLTDLALHWRGFLTGRTLLVTTAVTNLGDVRWESVRRYPAVGRAWSMALTFAP